VITLEVFGRPTPQGSKQIFHGRLVEAQAANLKKWRKAIEDACQPYADQNINLGPVRLEVDFYLQRPKTVRQQDRALPIVPPDLDKLIRAVGDGIGQSGLIWGDDSQIVEIVARKFYADGRETGADIRILPLYNS
jgi:Holliday junction resolvase RusA-like endonuclease